MGYNAGFAKAAAAAGLQGCDLRSVSAVAGDGDSTFPAHDSQTTGHDSQTTGTEHAARWRRQLAVTSPTGPKNPPQTKQPAISPVEQAALQAGGYELRYPPNEKLPAIVVDNFPNLGRLTALRFLEWVAVNPEGVVALPTGKTPEYFIKYVTALSGQLVAQGNSHRTGGARAQARAQAGAGGSALRAAR
jgi:hypothetical protein